MGTMSLLIFGTGGDSPITKIATVGPFFRAKILPGQAEVEPAVSSSSTTGNAFGQTEIDTQTEAAAIPQAEVASLTEEEVEERLGFALPDNSVNSITQIGVGTRLVIPKMNLDAPILLAPIENQTWKVDHLIQEVGHLEGTAAPGSNSNLVLAAHVTLDSGDYGPFAGLGKLTSGDIVTVYDGEQKFDYIIDSQTKVDRTAVDVTFPSETGEITLITCNNWNAAEERYTQRLIIKGHLLTN
jgi:LPXTG-site transpeptidase (sortase) family protein